MTLADTLRFVMRAVHIGATAIWLGTGLVFLLTQPGLRQSVTSQAWAEHSRTLGRAARHSFTLLVASGAYMVFDRLANPRLGMAYIGVLVVKLALVAAIVWVAATRGGARRKALMGNRADPAWWLLALGVGALLLGVALTLIYEGELGAL